MAADRVGVDAEDEYVGSPHIRHFTPCDENGSVGSNINFSCQSVHTPAWIQIACNIRALYSARLRESTQTLAANR